MRFASCCSSWQERATPTTLCPHSLHILSVGFCELQTQKKRRRAAGPLSRVVRYRNKRDIDFFFFFHRTRKKKNPTDTLTFFAERCVWVVSDFSVSLLSSSVSRRGWVIVGVRPWDNDDGGGRTHSWRRLHACKRSHFVRMRSNQALIFHLWGD